MKHTPPISTTATPPDHARPPEPPQPTFGAMLEEVMDLIGGLGVALLPLIVLSVPAIVLFVVLPGLLLLALAVPLVLIGAVLAAPPYLVARWLRRRRRRRTAEPAARHTERARWSVTTSGQSRVEDLRSG